MCFNLFKEKNVGWEKRKWFPPYRLPTDKNTKNFLTKVRYLTII